MAFTVTLRDGGSNTALTCNFNPSSATSCVDNTHSVNISAGDVIDWQIVTTGTITGTPTIVITAANGTSGVGVTTIAPGFFTSAMSDRFMSNHPLKLSTEAAARRITQAIARDAGRCIFPRRIGFALRLLELLPAALADRATRLFRFKIRPD